MDYVAMKPVMDELRKWADPKEGSLALMLARLENACGR